MFRKEQVDKLLGLLPENVTDLDGVTAELSLAAQELSKLEQTTDLEKSVVARTGLTTDIDEVREECLQALFKMDKNTGILLGVASTYHPKEGSVKAGIDALVETETPAAAHRFEHLARFGQAPYVRERALEMLNEFDPGRAYKISADLNDSGNLPPVLQGTVNSILKSERSKTSEALDYSNEKELEALEIAASQIGAALYETDPDVSIRALKGWLDSKPGATETKCILVALTKHSSDVVSALALKELDERDPAIAKRVALAMQKSLANETATAQEVSRLLSEE